MHSNGVHFLIVTASDSLLQDEKSVIVTVTYLCARLMTLRREIRVIYQQVLLTQTLR